MNYLWNYFYSFSLIVLPILVCYVCVFLFTLKTYVCESSRPRIKSFSPGKTYIASANCLRAPLMHAYMKRKHKLSRPLMWSKFGQNLSGVLYILVILKLWIFFPIYYHLHSTYKQQLSQSHLGVEDKNCFNFGFPYLKDIFWPYIN